jgi:transketolase
MARAARLLVLDMCHRARTGHIGSVLSCIDILVVLVGQRLQLDAPKECDRDRFILSKGHATAGLYAVLHLKGVLTAEDIERYCQDESPLIGHANHVARGVDVSTGSLGMGVGVGAGIALGQRTRQATENVTKEGSGKPRFSPDTSASKT